MAKNTYVYAIYVIESDGRKAQVDEVFFCEETKEDADRSCEQMLSIRLPGMNVEKSLIDFHDDCETGGPTL